MDRITIITNSDHDTLVEEYNSKVKQGVNQFVLELHRSKTIVFDNIANIEKLELIEYDVLIVEDELTTALDYIKILNDAPLVRNILVTTKPQTTKNILIFLSEKNILNKLKVIFLDFNLKESNADANANGVLASRNWESIYLTYLKNQFFPPKVFGITAFEGVGHQEYSDLQKNMREHDDFVISKSFLTEKIARELFISILKSIPGLYWKGKEREMKMETNKIEMGNELIAEYERKNPIPKNIGTARLLLENIEISMPDILANEKFLISKQAGTIKKTAEDGNFSSQQTLDGSITSAAKGIVWLLNHPENKDKFPKFRHQHNIHKLFETQIKNGINKK